MKHGLKQQASYVYGSHPASVSHAPDLNVGILVVGASLEATAKAIFCFMKAVGEVEVKNIDSKGNREAMFTGAPKSILRKVMDHDRVLHGRQGPPKHLFRSWRHLDGALAHVVFFQQLWPPPWIRNQWVKINAVRSMFQIIWWVEEGECYDVHSLEYKVLHSLCSIAPLLVILVDFADVNDEIEIEDVKVEAYADGWHDQNEPLHEWKGYSSSSSCKIDKQQQSYCSSRHFEVHGKAQGRVEALQLSKFLISQELPVRGTTRCSWCSWHLPSIRQLLRHSLELLIIFDNVRPLPILPCSNSTLIFNNLKDVWSIQETEYVHFMEQVERHLQGFSVVHHHVFMVGITLWIKWYHINKPRIKTLCCGSQSFPSKENEMHKEIFSTSLLEIFHRSLFGCHMEKYLQDFSTRLSQRESLSVQMSELQIEMTMKFFCNSLLDGSLNVELDDYGSALRQNLDDVFKDLATVSINKIISTSGDIPIVASCKGGNVSHIVFQDGKAMSTCVGVGLDDSVVVLDKSKNEIVIEQKEASLWEETLGNIMNGGGHDVLVRIKRDFTCGCAVSPHFEGQNEIVDEEISNLYGVKFEATCTYRIESGVACEKTHEPLLWLLSKFVAALSKEEAFTTMSMKVRSQRREKMTKGTLEKQMENVPSKEAQTALHKFSLGAKDNIELEGDSGVAKSSSGIVGDDKRSMENVPSNEAQTALHKFSLGAKDNIELEGDSGSSYGRHSGIFVGYDKRSMASKSNYLGASDEGTGSQDSEIDVGGGDNNNENGSGSGSDNRNNDNGSGSGSDNRNNDNRDDSGNGGGDGGGGGGGGDGGGGDGNGDNKRRFSKFPVILKADGRFESEISPEEIGEQLITPCLDFEFLIEKGIKKERKSISITACTTFAHTIDAKPGDEEGGWFHDDIGLGVEGTEGEAVLKGPGEILNEKETYTMNQTSQATRSRGKSTSAGATLGVSSCNGNVNTSSDNSETRSQACGMQFTKGTICDGFAAACKSGHRTLKFTLHFPLSFYDVQDPAIRDSLKVSGLFCTIEPKMKGTWIPQDDRRDSPYIFAASRIWKKNLHPEEIRGSNNKLLQYYRIPFYVNHAMTHLKARPATDPEEDPPVKAGIPFP